MIIHPHMCEGIFKEQSTSLCQLFGRGFRACESAGGYVLQGVDRAALLDWTGAARPRFWARPLAFSPRRRDWCSWGQLRYLCPLTT